MPNYLAPTYVGYVVTCGQLVNTFLPARAGDFLKIGLFRTSLSVLSASSVVLSDKIVDIGALVLLLLVIGTQELPPMSAFPSLFPYALGGVAVGAALVGIGFYLPKKYRNAIQGGVQEIRRGFSGLTHPMQVARALAFGMLGWTSEAFAVYFLSHAFGASISIPQALWILALLNLAIAIPIAIANVGAFEAAIIFGITALGYKESLGLAVGTVYHALQIAGIVVMAGMFALIRLLPKKKERPVLPIELRDSLTGSITIEVLSEANKKEWDDFVKADPRSTCYHHRGWENVGRKAYRLETYYLLARQKATGRVCGALPLFFVPGPLEGHLTSGLFGSYNSVLGTDDESKHKLLHCARQIFEQKSPKYFMIKSTEAEPIPWSDAQSIGFWAIAMLEVDPDPEVQWKTFRSEIRNRIRNAQKYNLQVRTGHDQLESYYDVLCENMHSKGAPLYGIRFMEEILAGFGADAEILTLWEGNQAISGAMILFHRDVVTVPFVSSRPSKFHLNPNNLLYWEIMKLGYGRGMRVLDFGSSLKNSSSLTFKERFGARVIDQYTYVVNRKAGHQANVDRGDPFIEAAVVVFKHTPRWMMDSLGPFICRRWLA